MTPRRLTGLAMVLWLVLAFLVWNVVFDRMIVLAGRRYSHDAAVLYQPTQFIRISPFTAVGLSPFSRRSINTARLAMRLV